jgi:hypothetical protein
MIRALSILAAVAALAVSAAPVASAGPFNGGGTDHAWGADHFKAPTPRTLGAANDVSHLSLRKASPKPRSLDIGTAERLDMNAKPKRLAEEVTES